MGSHTIIKSRQDSPNSKVVLAERKKQIFLSILAQTGKVIDAAKAVGYYDSAEMYKHRREDEEFAEAWDLALKAAGDVIEAEAIRRAVQGVQKPVFYKGQVVGYETQYSDGILTTLLKGHKPQYKEGGNNVQVNTNIGVTVLPMVSADPKDWERQAIDLHATEVVEEEEKK